MNTEHQAVPDPDGFGPPYFFFSHNRKSELLYVSPSVEQVLGFRPTEMIGRQYSDFLDSTSPLNSDVVKCRKRGFKSGKNFEQLRVVETRDKQLKVLKVQTYGQQDSQGRVTTNYGIAQDVTDAFFVELEFYRRLKKLQKAVRKLSDRERFVLDRVMEGMPNKAIAKKLDVSLRTVEKIRAQIVETFDSETMIEVVAKATELRILRDVVLSAHEAHQGPNKPTRHLLRKLFRDVRD